MSKITTTIDHEEYDVDADLATAIASLRESAWRINRASYALGEMREMQMTSLTRHGHFTIGMIVGMLDFLATQIQSIATQVRRLRKLARDG